MKKMIVWTIAVVFALCTSLAFAAEEKAEKPKGEATVGAPTKEMTPAPPAGTKKEKRVKKKGQATAGEPTKEMTPAEKK